MQLTDLQQVTLSVAEQDSKAQPVSDTLAWSVDNPRVIALVPSADTQSCLCVAGVDGTAVVTVTDNSVTPPLTASDTLTVVSSAATSLVISEGTPEDQPPAGADAFRLTKTAARPLVPFAGSAAGRLLCVFN